MKIILDRLYTTRGNATAVTGWLLPSTAITSYQQYDIAGNAVKAKDGRGYETTVEYGSPRINTDGSGNVTARHDYMPLSERSLPAARSLAKEVAFTTKKALPK